MIFFIGFSIALVCLLIWKRLRKSGLLSLEARHPTDPEH